MAEDPVSHDATKNADSQRPARELAVQYRNIDTLIPYINNARTHSDEQVAQIASSIKEFGWTNPVLVDGDNGIIAGHGRVLAARKLEATEIPVIELQGLSEAQRRAYILADNRLAQNAGWDEDLLTLELTELSNADFDLSLLGFDQRELADLLADEPEEGLTDPDEVPELEAEAVTQPGDLWQLGSHRLLCGDSTDEETVTYLLDGQTVALVHADPPYGMGKEKDGVQNDNLRFDKLDAFQMEWWKAVRPHIEDNGSVYIWGTATDLWRLWYVGGLNSSERMTIRNEIVWDKKSGQGMSAAKHRMFPTATERCLFFMLGDQTFNTSLDNYVPLSHPDHQRLLKEFYASRAYFDNTHENMTDVWDMKLSVPAITDMWEFDRVSGDARHGHATPKPVAMMERVMRSSLPAGDICYEPFAGSGSTLMGAQRTGRKCYTMELTPVYCDVIVKRWEAFTGKKATLSGYDGTFEDLQQERLNANTTA